VSNSHGWHADDGPAASEVLLRPDLGAGEEATAMRHLDDGALLPRRFRRRLTLTFVAVAALSAGFVAIGSLVVVRTYRFETFVDRARRDATVGLALVADDLSPQEVPDLLGNVAAPAGVEVVALLPDATVSTARSIELEDIPDSFRSSVDGGGVEETRLEIAGTPYTVLGGVAPGTDITLYYLFSRADLEDSIAALAQALAGTWLAVVLVAAVAGNLVARRTLAPVAASARAARRLAEGLLDTRLDMGRTDEFGAWATTFNEMADALEQKIAGLSAALERDRRFTADVAHDLRTPLTALVTESELLARHLDQLPQDARRPAELLVRDVGRLRRLVEDLLELSRLDAGAAPVRRDHVDLAAVAGAVVRRHGDHRIALDVEPAWVVGDVRRLDRIVSNLVANALEHGGTDVCVRVRRESLSATVEVSDQGPGIRAEDHGRIFERFARGDASRTGGGSGLGLAIAQENALLLGATLDVRSRPGQGATFRLSMPATVAPDDRAVELLPMPDQASNR
jgi:two-component system, OmpR family, sensor histidine kinase MtrB